MPSVIQWLDLIYRGKFNYGSSLKWIKKSPGLSKHTLCKVIGFGPANRCSVKTLSSCHLDMTSWNGSWCEGSLKGFCKDNKNA